VSEWFKSSKSGPWTDNCVEVKFNKSTSSTYSGNCVEVSSCDCGVQVRDSKDRQGTVLTFTHPEWEAFLAGVREGEFDL
jgi:hypothetical protein